MINVKDEENVFESDRYKRLKQTAKRVKLYVTVEFAGKSTKLTADRRFMMFEMRHLLDELTTSQYSYVSSVCQNDGGASATGVVEFRACIGDGGYRLDKMGPFSSAESMLDHFRSVAETLSSEGRVVLVDADIEDHEARGYSVLSLV